MAQLGYRLGFWLRETGGALERLGMRLQGSYAFREEREWRGAPISASGARLQV